MKNIEINTADVAASFQESVVDVLVTKTIKAAKEHKIDKVAIAGGVAANSHLREDEKQLCTRRNNPILSFPSLLYR